MRELQELYERLPPSVQAYLIYLMVMTGLTVAFVLGALVEDYLGGI
jgi:hypothetical protein